MSSPSSTSSISSTDASPDLSSIMEFPPLSISPAGTPLVTSIPTTNSMNTSSLFATPDDQTHVVDEQNFLLPDDSQRTSDPASDGSESGELSSPLSTPLHEMNVVNDNMESEVDYTLHTLEPIQLLELFQNITEQTLESEVTMTEMKKKQDEALTEKDVVIETLKTAIESSAMESEEQKSRFRELQDRHMAFIFLLEKMGIYEAVSHLTTAELMSYSNSLNNDSIRAGKPSDIQNFGSLESGQSLRLETQLKEKDEQIEAYKSQMEKLREKLSMKPRTVCFSDGSSKEEMMESLQNLKAENTNLSAMLKYVKQAVDGHAKAWSSCIRFVEGVLKNRKNVQNQDAQKNHNTFMEHLNKVKGANLILVNEIGIIVRKRKADETLEDNLGVKKIKLSAAQRDTEET